MIIYLNKTQKDDLFTRLNYYRFNYQINLESMMIEDTSNLDYYKISFCTKDGSIFDYFNIYRSYDDIPYSSYPSAEEEYDTVNEDIYLLIDVFRRDCVINDILYSKRPTPLKSDL